MKKIFALLLFLLPVAVSAQQDSVLSQVYPWKESTVLFEGKVHDMKWLQFSTASLQPSKKISERVPKNEEQMIIIQSGRLSLRIGDSLWTIGNYSVFLVMPGEKYTIRNEEDSMCRYFVMKYTSRESANKKRGHDGGGSIVRDWSKIAFIRQERGGRRNFFERPTAMCRRFEMHTTTLKEGLQSHDPHKHKAEEIVLMIEGDTEMLIGDKYYKGKTGDVYYLGSNVLHGIKNVGKGMCTYFAFQFE